jgi:hypothetical protein
MLKDGFFSLQTPQDLLAKLEHDFKRHRKNPIDTYAAFDFVVTATQLHDWARRSGISERPTEALHQLVFKVCGDLGNGAKHFAMRQRRPEGHSIAEARYGEATYGDARYGGALVVALSEAEASVYGQPTITVLELAAMVLAYWEEILL